MSSTINPITIDVTYPIAGQDNDTQGFRDNFSGIKNNFTIAKSEISAIQAVLSSTPAIKTSPPATHSDIGAKGEIAFDSTYLYVCIDTNTWVRAGLTDWTGSTNVLPMFYGNSNVAAYIPTYSGNVSNVGVTGALTSYGSRIESGYQYYAPSTNFTYTMWSNISRFIMDPSGTITNGNVLLPSGNVDAQVITISSTSTVTNFKVTANNGTTLVPSANITLTAGTAASYFFHANESKWYKIA